MENENLEKENEALIAEMVSRIGTATRESIALNPVIHKGDGTLPAPMVMTIEDEGLVIIYRTITGEPVKVLKYMLKDYLKAKNPDGTTEFTAVKPSFEPKRGILKCFLHPDGEKREHYNELGLPVCRKSNLTAPYMVEQHMKKRHPSAWAIIERERTDQEKEADKEFQRTLLKGLVKINKKK